MITFNVILRESGLDTKDVQLARHQDTRTTSITTPYQLWQDNRSEFERYQQLQARSVFHLDKYLASFVTTPERKTLFVGLYRITSKGKSGVATCPVSGSDCTGHILYGIQREDRLDEYSGRLFIEWSFRNWVLNANGKNQQNFRNQKRKRREGMARI